MDGRPGGLLSVAFFCAAKTSVVARRSEATDALRSLGEGGLTAFLLLSFSPEIDLKSAVSRVVLETAKTRLPLKSGNPLTFSDFEGDLTPSDFELNSHPVFAKTDAYHFAISAKNALRQR